MPRLVAFVFQLADNGRESAIWDGVPPAVPISALALAAAASQSRPVTSAATARIPTGLGCGPLAPMKSASSLCENVSRRICSVC